MNALGLKPSRHAEERRQPNPEVGQSVKVVSGPLAEFDGVVSVSPDAGKVKVLVSIFGRETPVELSFDQISRFSEHRRRRVPAWTGASHSTCEDVLID